MNSLSYKAELFLLELRSAADQDYILARIAYRWQLDMQFVWLAHQAIEKYLKVLLIFNDRSAKRVGHNLREAWQRLTTVVDVPFRFPDLLPDFIGYLDARYDRYAERPYSVTLDRLVDLDAAVWHLRRFCCNLRGNSEPRLHITREDRKRLLAQLADQAYDSHPYRYILGGGYLEAVRQDHTSSLRAHLLWNNLYFSRRRRTSLKGRPNRAVNSLLVLYPEIVLELRDKLDFSAETRSRAKDAIRTQ
jgi:HEPN domain-containing protein